jgi:hypothetical protein
MDSDRGANDGDSSKADGRKEKRGEEARARACNARS